MTALLWKLDSWAPDRAESHRAIRKTSVMSDRECSCRYLNLQTCFHCWPHVINIFPCAAGTPTLQQLLEALKNSDSWFLFGAMLGVPVSQLRKIELDHQKDSNRCKLELLQYWLDTTLSPTWNEIVQALEKTDQLALAAQIKHDYLWSTVVIEEEGMPWNDNMCVLNIIFMNSYCSIRCCFNSRSPYFYS